MKGKVLTLSKEVISPGRDTWREELKQEEIHVKSYLEKGDYNLTTGLYGGSKPDHHLPCLEIMGNNKQTIEGTLQIKRTSENNL